MPYLTMLPTGSTGVRLAEGDVPNVAEEPAGVAPSLLGHVLSRNRHVSSWISG